MADLTQFNATASDGKVLSPLAQEYPNTPLPQEIKDYVKQQVSLIDDADHLDRRYDFDEFVDAENDSFQALYYAFSTKGKLRRLSIDYSNMINHDGLGEDNQTQWKRATLLKSAIDIRSALATSLDTALNELGEQNFLSDTTIQNLVQLSVATGHVNIAMTEELHDFMQRNPDPAYDSGDKEKHFLFDATNSMGGHFHIPDLRHGAPEEQLSLVSEGVSLAQSQRYTFPQLRNSERNQLTVNRSIKFDDLVKRSIWGKGALETDPTPDGGEPPTYE